jgi:hypothetical protein
MRAYCPDVKLVYMVRHPIERIVSAWIQYRQDQGDFVHSDIDRAVREKRDLFVEQSAYWTQLQRYRAHFPDSQIFVGYMEDLQANEESVLRPLCAFLGIDPEVRPAIHQANPSLGKPVPKPALTAVRRLPGMGALIRVAPQDIKGRIKRRLFYEKLDRRPALSPEARAGLAIELAEDSAALLRHTGKPADFWIL